MMTTRRKESKVIPGKKMTKKQSNKYVEDQLQIYYEKIASYRRGDGW
jgi:hypothetical protein